MKIMFAVALATIALPVYAQDQAAPPPPAATTNGIPNTTLSTSPTPSDGPRAQEGNLPSNNAAAAAGGGEQSTEAVMAAPAPLDHYPICKRGQFDKCMEPGNGGGGSHTTHHRRHHK